MATIPDPPPPVATVPGPSTPQKQDNSSTSSASSPAGTPMTISENFLLKEYEALRQEILGALKQIVGIEYYAILITGVTWAWLVAIDTRKAGPLAYFAPFIPLCLVLLYRNKRNFLDRHIIQMGEYVKRVEKRLLVELTELPPNERFGWEHREKRPFPELWVKWFWRVLIGLNLVAAIAFEGMILRDLLSNWLHRLQWLR
jgi:hypothetical protein